MRERGDGRGRGETGEGEGERGEEDGERGGRKDRRRELQGREMSSHSG